MNIIIIEVNNNLFVQSKTIRDTNTGEIYTANVADDSRNIFSSEEYSASKVKIYVYFFFTHTNLV